MLRTVRDGACAITYELIKTGRQNIEIRVLPEGVRVFAPSRTSLRAADDFVLAHAQWIAEAQESYRRYIDKTRLACPLMDGTRFPLEGKTVTLRLLPGGGPARLEGDCFFLPAPGDEADSVKEALSRALAARFRDRLNEQLSHYIPLVGRTPGQIAVRNQRTRWGSCSARGNLSFNWKLILAPPEALDYVVIHELCHLWEFNHSDRFWRRVAAFQPEYAQWRDFLRKFAQTPLVALLSSPS